MERREHAAAWGLIAAIAIGLGTLSLFRHWSFHSTGLDLAVFDQALWNTANGRFMESTLSLGRCDPHSFFGDHFSPVLLALVPFYWLAPGPEILLVAQALALGLGAWPLYLLARRAGLSHRIGLTWIGVYALSAPLSFAALYDFHEVAFSVLPLGLALYFLSCGRTGPFLAALFSTFLIKEEFALVGIAFGVALLIRRDRRLAAVVLAAGVVTFVLTLKLVIPAFAGGTSYQYFGRYASLGSNELEVVRTLLLDPLRVGRVLFSGEVGSKIVFMLSLYAPGLFLAVRTPWAAVTALPTIGYLLLSDYGGEHTLHNQYGLPLIPLVLGASILGLATVAPSRRRAFSAATLVVALFFAGAFGGLPLTPGFADAFLRGDPDRAPAPWSVVRPEERYDAAFLAAIRAIPPGAKVSSRDYLLTQIGERRYEYHNGGLDICDADHVILDYAAPEVNRDPMKHQADIDALRSRGFTEIARGEGLSLLRR